MQNIRETFNKLNMEQRAYCLGVIGLLCYFVKWILPFPWYWLSIVSFLTGLILWINNKLTSINSQIFGKAISGLGLLGGITFNIAFASSIVNTTLEVPSSAFGYTVTLISIFTTPLTLAILMLFGFVPLILLAMLDGTNELTKKTFHHGIVITGRIIAIIMIAALLEVNFLKNNEWYSNPLSDFTKWFAYNFEMETYSYCKLANGEKITYLGGDKIVVGKKSEDNYIFSIEECEE